MKRLLSLVILALLLATVGVGLVSAQEVAPEDLTMPAFDQGAIVTSGMGMVTGFAVLMVTVAAIKLGPKFISSIRRMLSAAVGR